MCTVNLRYLLLTDLDLDLVGGVVVLPVDADDVEADVAQVAQRLLLEVSVRVHPDPTVVNAIVDPVGVLGRKIQLQGPSTVPHWGKIHIHI